MSQILPIDFSLLSPLLSCLQEKNPTPHKPRAGGLALVPDLTQNVGIRAASTSLLFLFPTLNVYPTSHINDAGGITAVLGIVCTSPGTISSLLLNAT